MEDSVNSVNMKNLEGSKMNTERQPLLSAPDVDHHHLVRPDLRSSPVDILVDVQNENEQKEDSTESSFFNSTNNEYEPSKHRTLEHPTSNLDTMIHLLKGNIGTGILAMPDAFKNAGLYVGLFGTLIMGAICTHCMHMLVRCCHELSRRCQVPSLSFSEVCFASFETGPQGIRRYSHIAKNLINLFLIVTQLGFCCVYFVFVAVNVQEIVTHYFTKLDIRVYLLLMLLPMIGLNLVKNLKYLTPFSLIAAILTVSGLAICFYYMIQDLPNTDTVPKFASWATLPLYFGTAIYAFEGIGVVLPLENNMKNPEDFGGWTGVLNTGMVIVACLYTSVGFFGYLKFGDAVKGSITLNLGDDTLAEIVRLMMAIAIFLSYTLQFYVPINIVGPWLRSKLVGTFNQNVGEYLLRIGIVLFTFILAAMVPNLGAVISLVGAISSSTLALIFPPIIEIVTFWPNGFGKCNWIFWKDIFIMIFGILGFLFGSFTSIYQILHPELQKD